MHQPPRVALLIETSTSWGHYLVRGIAQYARRHGPWLFFLEPRGRNEKTRLPRGWDGDGVIARINNPRLAEDIKHLGVPAVNVSWFDFGFPDVPRCTTSETGVGEIAAEYLADQGFRHYAYYPTFDRPGYKDRLGPAFARTVEKRGGACCTFPGTIRSVSRRSWDEHRTDVAHWLQTLPKPLAVLSFGDYRARTLTEACLIANLRVPDDVAVLGAEQDKLSSVVSNPELSSIDNGPRRVGFAAAELLDRMMHGEAAPTEPIEFAPVGIIPRQSTEVLAIDDPNLAAAFRFIRDHAHEPITVGDVLRVVPLARRAFEQHFMAAVGRTPAATIRHIRLQRAKRALYDTNQSIAEIAQTCGFSHPEAMTRAFKAEFRISPSNFRRKVR